MLANALKEHPRTSTYNTDAAKRDATLAASVATDTLADILNADVATAFKNQKDLETEAKRLQSNTAKFTKQTNEWLALVNDFSSALKELGDLGSWSRAIETDLADICSVIENANKRS
ncbi:biogenesis of lysosome- organelles complex 1 subunit 1 [Rhizophlyctis rosea]|nr:biogenesis of lysosome- organelles complex 1 subunit 1 [Rhizophlyctis rosea]